MGGRNTARNRQTASARKDRHAAGWTAFLVAAAISLAASMWTAATAHAQTPTLDHSSISVLDDRSSGLSLNDVLSPDVQRRFRPVRGPEVNFGYIDHAVWIKLELSGMPTTEAVLSVAPTFLDYIDIYAASPEAAPAAEAFTVYQGGDHRPPSEHGLSALDKAAPLALEEGVPTYVYIRIFNTNSSTHISLGLENMQDRAASRVTQASIFGVWFGGMATLMVTQLVFFYFDRKRQYPLLALSTLGVFLIYFGNLGYSHVYLFADNGAANDLFIGVNAWGGLAVSALAYDSILDLKRRSPTVHGIYIAMALVGVVGVGFALAGRNIVFGPFGSAFSIIAATLNMLVGLRYANTDGAASRITAAAFVVIFVGASLSMVQRLGLAWMPNWTSHSYGISGLIQTILLTGALAIRLRDAEQENRRMTAVALHSAREAEQFAARLVDERTAELVQARAIAEDALNAEMQSQLRQVRFLEVVSHQYRTPLAAIRSSVDSLALDPSMQSNGNRERIDRIRRSVARMVEILEINLQRSRLQGASFRASPSRMTIGPIVRSSVLRARDLLQANDIRLDIPPHIETVRIDGDAGMLELALINLLENAIKYSSTQSEPTVALSMAREAGMLIVSVKDNGIGIPPADLPNVFEDAARGSNVSGTEGSGMGLFLVQRIVAAHGGTVTADSEIGKGTEIRITLPVAAA